MNVVMIGSLAHVLVDDELFPVIAGSQMDPLNAQGFRTQRAELPEDLWQPLYDRANIATSVAAQTAFYATPRGQSATLITLTTAASKVKSYRDTNMDNSNVVPTKLYKLIGVSIGYVHSALTVNTVSNDRTIFRDGTYFNLRIVDKDILFLPLICVPEVNPFTAITTTATSCAAPGGGLAAAMYRFPIPITINPYENFSVNLNTDGTVSITSTMDVYMILHSYMRRPT